MSGQTCRTCGTSKPITDFYRQSNGSAHRDCKDCWKAYVRRNRVARADQYREYERSRANHAHRVAARKEYMETAAGSAAAARASKKYIERNPSKRAAHVAVGNALRSGRLVRQLCEICGRSAQAHHDDYSKPLDVRWLCTAHHADWHKKNKPLCPDHSGGNIKP